MSSRKTASSEDPMMILLDWKLRLPSGYSGFLMLLNQQAKKGVIVLDGLNDPDYQGETEILHNGNKDEYVWNTEGPLRQLSSITMPCD